MALPSDISATLCTLTDKVKMMETHYGEQLRALVTKTKELQKMVKYQQEQLAALQPTGLPPPPPFAIGGVETAGLQETMSQIISEALSEAASEAEAAPSDSSLGDGDGATEATGAGPLSADAAARVLERESLLQDRIANQEQELQGANERIVEQESRMKKLEEGLEIVQGELRKALAHGLASDAGGAARPLRPSTSAAAAQANKERRLKAAEEENDKKADAGEASSSRLSLWANIRDRMFGGGASKARLLNLTIIEATFHDTSRNQKLPLDAHIEIRNITTGQVETTSTVRKSYKPKYNEHFVFRTKQNANDMIMMKIMEHGSVAGASPTIFGSVALPLDSKHTQGAQIPMPIFDEGLNMKGVVRVTAMWSTNYPRRIKITLQGIQDLPESADYAAVSCRLVTLSGKSQIAAKESIVLGYADFKGQSLDQVELADEADKLSLEIILYPESGDRPTSFGVTEVHLPGDVGKDETIAVGSAGGRPARVHFRTAWVE
jgi:uncharacterized coiled-coil protein SlyX